MSWLDSAACRGMDTEMFFGADRADRSTPNTAKAQACDRCQVATECLLYSLQWRETTEHGIYGGCDIDTRRALRRKAIKLGLLADEERPVRMVDVDLLVHGTEWGYRRHRKARETPCDDCKAANALRREKRRQVEQ